MKGPLPFTVGDVRCFLKQVARPKRLRWSSSMAPASPLWRFDSSHPSCSRPGSLEKLQQIFPKDDQLTLSDRNGAEASAPDESKDGTL